MQTFRDTAHLYAVLDPFFKRMTTQPEIADSLAAGAFVLRFRYTEPDGQVTIDLREQPISWTFGETPLAPDLEMIQSADTAHRFWLGQLNVPGALATRKVVARGPVTKALKLLPAIKPAFPIYAQVLRDEGHAALIPAAPATPGWLTALRRALARPGRLVESLRRRVTTPAPSAALDHLRLIPREPAPREAAPALRQQHLPTEATALHLEMLRRMALIRAFEQRLARAYASGEVPTEAIHLSVGQEATAVGVCFALRADDQIATTHRGHGHMLAKGADLDGMAAEILAKASGLCGGKGGSMHVTDAAVGALGANGIVGASPLMAAGAAHAAVQRGDDQVAVAFLGDGATNQGMFHEALNFAAVFDLPAIFVVENNLYGEFTALSRHARVERLADRAAAYGIVGETVDGNDVQAVHAATTAAVARARRGEGPTLLECLTYRWHGHMEGDAADYRPDGELEQWQARCPIKRAREALDAQGALDATAADTLDREAVEAVEQAFSRAAAAPEPRPEALFEHVYAPEPAALYEARPPVPGPGCRELTCSQALYEALEQELERDERVYMLGEDVTTGGYFAVTTGLGQRFGAARIVDTPISEYAIVGTAVGAAMAGRRPVAEILFSDFITTCMDPLVNQAAKLRYMSGGQYTLPLVVRTPGGAGLGMAAQHSQSLEALLAGVPGLIIVAPATPFDAKGLLKAAIRSNNPVLFFENKLLYADTGPVPEEDYLVPLGSAEIKRAGRDATVVTVGAALGKALEAAEALAAEGLEPEVVDLRTLVPLDLDTIVRSVARTGRLITVEDAPLTGGFGAEVVARVAETAQGALRAAPRRVAAQDVPIPYNTALENAALPDAQAVVEAVRAAVRGGR